MGCCIRKQSSSSSSVLRRSPEPICDPNSTEAAAAACVGGSSSDAPRDTPEHEPLVAADTSGVACPEQQELSSAAALYSEPRVVARGTGSTLNSLILQGGGLRVVLDRSNTSAVIDTLVSQTLHLIRTMVNNEQPPPEAMVYLHKIAEHDSGWLAIVHSMINVITCDDPLGPAVMTLILDDCPLPAKEAIVTLEKFLAVCGQTANDSALSYARHRNVCILYGCLAEKLAGAASTNLLTANLIDYLVENLKLDKHPCVIVHALVAIEKLSLTGDNKPLLSGRLLETGDNLLERLAEWRNDRLDFQKREVGFCAEWILENLYTHRLSKECAAAARNHDVQAMLNANDTSEYLKMSADGLEARSDVLSFESVRCTFQADHGSWYYEVQLVTSGVMQIGWATRSSKFLNHDGYGIGDDEFSIAYDGCRQLIWHNALSERHLHRCWRPGDILGCYLNIDDMAVIFTLNGDALPPQNQIFRNARQGFFAAASFMSFQQCIFNFGREPFRYPPSCSFESFNNHGVLQEKDRVILPRHKRIELLRNMTVLEDGCAVCCDDAANITLHPCGHRGLCQSCAVQVDACPFCRQAILSMDVDNSDSDASSSALMKDDHHCSRPNL